LRCGDSSRKIGDAIGEGKHMRRVMVLAICFGLFAAPALAQSKAAIQKLDDQFGAAFNKGNTAALAAMYTKDAYVLPAGAPMIKGTAAIEKFWKEALNHMQDLQCTALDVKSLGGRAAREIGTCSFMTKKAPVVEGAIKYAVVWEKEGGKWKLLQDIWNTDK
jgi:uncharacterized protein (TIGR02246 family)